MVIACTGDNRVLRLNDLALLTGLHGYSHFLSVHCQRKRDVVLCLQNELCDLSTAPIRRNGQAASGFQAGKAALREALGQSGQQLDTAIVALQEHFHDACGCAELLSI